MDQYGCDPADRLCRETAEFEGRPTPAGAAATSFTAWEPQSHAELAVAWVMLPLMLLALVSRFWQRHSDRRRTPGPAGIRSRRFVAHSPQPLDPSSSAAKAVAPARQREAEPAAALPPHRSRTAASLIAAADAAASVALLPLSILQLGMQLAGLGGGRRSTAAAAAADPRTPKAAAATPGSQPPRSTGPGSGTRYGMGYGEAESEEEEWEEGSASELTEASLRRLETTPEFRAFLKARGLTPSDVGRSKSRLRLYRRLRRLDPPAFWQLLRAGSRTVFQSRPPSRLMLAADYLLSTGADVAAAAATAWLCMTPLALPTPLRAAAAAAVLWLAAAPWLQARPTAGGLFGLWFEEPRWGHAAPAWRGVAAGLLELVYVAGSAGIGTVVSLWLRCISARRQSVGELLAGVHAVQEVQLSAPVEGEG